MLKRCAGLPVSGKPAIVRIRITALLVYCSLVAILLCNAASAATINLPQTGQTNCYDAGGAVISCTGTGQTGEYLQGVAWPGTRFMVNASAPDNGESVTDRLTGLVWTKDALTPAGATGCPGGGTMMSWQPALDFIACLNTNSYLGYNDWRLPQRNELESLAARGKANTADWLNASGGFGNPFLNVQSSRYWSGSTHAANTDLAWDANMSDGSMGYESKLTAKYIWPVRTGQAEAPAEVWKTGQSISYDAGTPGIDDGALQSGAAWPFPRFTDNGNGTVTDNLTGLAWLKNANCFGGQTWSSALALARGLASGACGLSDGSASGDWSLPNEKELLSLIDTSVYNPSFPEGHPFSGVQSIWYWSGSTFEADKAQAWGVLLYDGFLNHYEKIYEYYVWPVRRGTGLSGLPAVSVSPAGNPEDLGMVNPGSISAPKIFTVTNTGTSTLFPDAITLGGTDAGQFIIQSDSCSWQTLAPGGNCQFAVAAFPTSTGQKNASVNIASNAPGSPTAVNIRATGSQFNISASVPGGNGTISCQSPVNPGGSSVCTISPANGYYLQNLADNGTAVGGYLVRSGGLLTYTFSNVTADHTNITATFAPGAHTLNLPQTGQVTCYDAGGVTKNCAGTGQDGEELQGVAWPYNRFTVNAHAPDSGGSVTDRLTGLVWTKDANAPVFNICGGGASMTWQGALTYVDCLNTGRYLGHNDWRLPNINELQSILNLEQASTAGWLNASGGFGNPFLNIQSDYYWTGSTNAYDKNNRWIVNMESGHVARDVVAGIRSVWPVRAGSGAFAHSDLYRTGQTVSYAPGDDGELEKGVLWPSPRFTDNSNGTVTDNLTGLVWLKNANCFGGQAWSSALTLANGLASGICGLNDASVAGDWRLPNRVELSSLIDHSRYGYSIPPGNPFVNLQLDYYWASTTYAGTTASAWIVYMLDGGVGYHGKTSAMYVWPVRAGSGAYGSPGISPSPSPKDYAIVIPGTSASQTFTLTDTGANYLSTGTVSLGGADSGQFSIRNDSCGNRAVAPGSTCTVDVLFSPSGMGTKSASLNIASNAPGAPLSVSLSGIGAQQYTIDTSASGMGAGSVSSSPAGISYSYGTTASGSALFWQGSTVTLTALASSISTAAWVCPGGVSSGNDTASATCTYANLASAQSVAAVFSLRQYTLTAGTEPADAGTITGVNNPYSHGSTASISVSADAGYRFTAWSGCSASTVEGIDVYMDGDKTCTANFALKQYIISAAAPAGNGSITCESPVYHGSSSVCTITPAEGYYLKSITDSGAPVGGYLVRSGGNLTYTFANVSVDKNIVAAFAPGTHAVNLPRTGQTICYDGDGGVIDCAGSGQDGELLQGVTWPYQRFTVNTSEPDNRESVTDNLTGLVWSRDANAPAYSTCGGGVAMPWPDALAYVDCLNTSAYLGHNDWRLPNHNELRSIVNISQADSSVWLGASFVNVQSGPYWSSGTGASNTLSAWSINVASGVGNGLTKAVIHYVWPVRGIQSASSAYYDVFRTGQTESYAAGDDGALQKGAEWPAPRFTDNSDGTVTDSLTGLIWLKNANCFGQQTWMNALSSANALASGPCGLSDGSHAGDWRLPNREELLSIIDYSAYVPAITPGNPFTGLIPSYYWSSSTFAGVVGRAWMVAFSSGGEVYSTKTLNRYLWPVRRGSGYSGNPAVSVSPSPKDFGTVNPAGSASQTFTVTNTGTNLLSTGTLSLTGDNKAQFSIANDNCSNKTIAPSGTCTVDVVFSPTGSGARSAELSIPSNAPASSATVALSGTGAQYTIDTSASGNGTGSVSSLPAGISYSYSAVNSGSALFDHGSSVTLTAEALTGSTAVWTCPGGIPAGNGTSLAICQYDSLTQDQTASAVFTLNEHGVTGTASPAGTGTVACTSPVVHGGITDCTVTANPGYYVSAITGCGMVYIAGSTAYDKREISSPAVTGDCTVTAEFGQTGTSGYVVRRSYGPGGPFEFGSSITGAYNNPAGSYTSFGIELRNQTFAGSNELLFDKNYSVHLSGGWTPDFGSNAGGSSIIEGSLTISGGQCLVEGIGIK